MKTEQDRIRRLENEEIWATFWVSVYAFSLVGIVGAWAFQQPILTLASFVTCLFLFSGRVIQIKFG